MGTTVSATVLSNLHQILLKSSWLSRLAAFIWIPPQAPRSNQTVWTAGRSRETGISGYYGISHFPEKSTPDTTEIQLTLETFSFALNTTPSTSVQPNSTYNRKKSRNWDKWVPRLQRLSWANYTRYLPLLNSSWLETYSFFGGREKEAIFHTGSFVFFYSTFVVFCHHLLIRKIFNWFLQIVN